jgi:hypothetical protein
MWNHKTEPTSGVIQWIECDVQWKKRRLYTHVSITSESRLEGGANRAKLKFLIINTTTSRVSVRNTIEFAGEGAKQIASE